MKIVSISLILLIILMSCNEDRQLTDHLQLQSKLEGKWMAKAFDGELHDSWHLNQDGWMQQQGYYIEGRDTSYAAKTLIQKVGEEIILLSVIKDGNPKVFKSVQREDNLIVFKNDDYKNPYQVKYEFLSDTTYRRTIEGMEQDSLVRYVFDFKKVSS